jgi:hypothetical protein
LYVINNESVFYKAYIYFTLLGLATFWIVRFEPAPCDILFALAIAAWLVDRIINRKGVPLENTDWLLLGFLLTGWIGLAYTPSIHKSIIFAGITTYLAVFYYIIRHASRDFNLRNKIIYLYLGSALITVGLAWAAIVGSPLLHLPRESLLTDYYSGGATALFKDPNVTGAFMVPAALYFLWRCLQSLKPFGMAALFLFSECAIFLTLSRGSVMSLGLGCMIIFLLTPSTWRKRLALMVLSVLVVELLSLVLALYPPTHSRFERVFPHMALCRYIVTEKSLPPAGMLQLYPKGVIQDYDRGGRVYAWQAGLEIFKGRPVLGTGPGSFESLSPAIEERLGVKMITPSAHNLYIRALAENGIIGFTLLMGFLIYAWRNARYKGDNLWIKAALVALLVNAFFIDTLHHRHFWLLLALL